MDKIYTMSITLLICLLIPKGILTFNFAPNFGNGIFDPLLPTSDSSDDYLENDRDIMPIRKVRNEPNEPLNLVINNNARKSKDYEECLEVGSRILCGYGKNIGLNKVDQIIDLGNGCRLRGDRMECGYDNKLKLQDKTKQTEKPVERQRPTRTPISGISNKDHKVDSDILENKLLKSTLDEQLVKSIAKPSVFIEPATTTKETTKQISSTVEKGSV
ncbi:uncharacterized protein LOC118266515 [Spodoptera frugiperda]|uniref:Uncharacterized protein LOC118266515 n=1 Tax=Spodoptera frugiperda TaxID=7108 RepID=A0A9R0EHY2_SPOFR|nr:uncharacterized protein LOC118266515 [Spodoptera frugiperda]